MRPIIETKNVSVNYGRDEAVKDVSFEIQSGDFVGLIGPNGSGKTTLAKALLGILPIAKGEIILRGKSLKQFNDWDKINYLPQNIKSINPLFPATVEEVVFLGLLSSKKFPGYFSTSDRLRVEETLNSMSISDLKKKPISELSGGQQQRVLIARAFVSNPEILILDEPTTALDLKSRNEFIGWIKKLNVDRGITVVLITHDTNFVCKYANKLMYLDKKLIFFGSVKEFYASSNQVIQSDEYGKHIASHQHD